MLNYQSMRVSLNPTRIFKWLRYKINFYHDHPNYFVPDGLAIFTGPQGTGKTLSAVIYVDKLLKRYPHCILCTNLSLKGNTRSLSNG